jgi:hypothetical protein
MPDRAELVRRTEGKRVARVDEVGLGPSRVFEPRDLCCEGGCAGGVQIAAPQQPLNCFCLGVDREHAPTAPEQLDSVSPRAAAEIDGEQSSLVRARSGVEALEREQQRFPRLFARRVVVARPLGTHRRRQTNGDARARRLGVRPRVRPDIVPMTFTGFAPGQASYSISPTSFATPTKMRSVVLVSFFHVTIPSKREAVCVDHDLDEWTAVFGLLLTPLCLGSGWLLWAWLRGFFWFGDVATSPVVVRSLER